MEFKNLGPSAADANNPEGPKVVVLGEKSKAQLGRALPNNLALSFNQIGLDVPTFAEASAIADTIVKSGIKFDKVSMGGKRRRVGEECRVGEERERGRD